MRSTEDKGSGVWEGEVIYKRAEKVVERLECKKVCLKAKLLKDTGVCSADRDLKMFLNQMQFMDELYRKITLQGGSVAEISSLNSRRFILEQLALELFSAGWNAAPPGFEATEV